jgi:very-short-patch-repair endonuclease
MSQWEEALLLQIRAAQLPLPLREQPVAAGLGYRFDFLFKEAGMAPLAIEVDGGRWTGGRHQTGKGFGEDCFKLDLAALQGYRVLRFTAEMIESGQALEMIEIALGKRPVQPLIERRRQETGARRSAGARLGWAIRRAKQGG